MHKREATVPGPSSSGGPHHNVGSSPEGNEGESDFVMVPEHLTMDAAEVRLRQKTGMMRNADCCHVLE